MRGGTMGGHVPPRILRRWWGMGLKPTQSQGPAVVEALAWGCILARASSRGSSMICANGGADAASPEPVPSSNGGSGGIKLCPSSVNTYASFGF